MEATFFWKVLGSVWYSHVLSHSCREEFTSHWDQPRDGEADSKKKSRVESLSKARFFFWVPMVGKKNTQNRFDPCLLPWVSPELDYIYIYIYLYDFIRVAFSFLFRLWALDPNKWQKTCHVPDAGATRWSSCWVWSIQVGEEKTKIPGVLPMTIFAWNHLPDLEHHLIIL